MTTASNTLSHQEISHRAVSGVLVLVLRKAGLQIVHYLGSIFLARLLVPEAFGVFAIVGFVITFFNFFSDVGLGAALIQKKDNLTQKELAATFSFQQVLVLIVVGFIFTLAPVLAQWYGLGSDGVWLFRVFSLSLIFTSLKTIPSILLERKLLFGRVVIPEIVEVLTFQVVAVSLAVLEFGVWSFIVALLVRGVLGTLTMYVISPWKPHFAWDQAVAIRLMRFGLPFQLNGFIAMIKDAVLPVFVGAVSGVAAVGYLNWANTFSKLPVLFLSDIFRVTFPTYARIQDDPVLLKKAVERTLRFVNLVLYPAVFVLAATGREIVTIVFTDKWLPALPAFYIHLTGILVVGIANIFMDTFWALGKTGLAVRLLVFYTFLNWAISVPLVYWLGFNGAMVGAVVVLWVSLPLTIYYMKQIVPIDIWPQIKGSLFAAIIAGGITYWLSSRYVSNLWLLLLVGGFGGCIYLSMLLVLERMKIIHDIVWLLDKAQIPIPEGVRLILRLKVT